MVSATPGGEFHMSPRGIGEAEYITCPAIVHQKCTERAREVIREMVGEIRVTPENGHLFYEMGLNETPLTALAGGASQIDVVAGQRLNRDHSCGYP